MNIVAFLCLLVYVLVPIPTIAANKHSFGSSLLNTIYHDASRGSSLFLENASVIFKTKKNKAPPQAFRIQTFLSRHDKSSFVTKLSVSLHKAWGRVRTGGYKDF